MAEPFRVCQGISDALLAELLDDPELLAMWWQDTEAGMAEKTQVLGAVPVTAWEWEVHREEWWDEDSETGEVFHYSGYAILGRCLADHGPRMVFR
jgi:hypothetical protein